MKTCPSCHTRYTDDTLRFCLQDGTPLDIASVTEQPTVSFGGREIETSVRSNIPPRDSEAPQWDQKSEVTHVSSLKPKPSGSKTALAVAVTAFAMLLLFGVIGIGAWLYFKGVGDDIATNTNNGSGNQNIFPARNINSNGLITPTPAAIKSPTSPVVNNSSSPPVSIVTPTPPGPDKPQASREVTQQIYDWKSLAESGDLDGYMSKYANTVDYYRKRNASVGFVRSDKQRAFTMFDSISFTVSNMNILVDDSGDRASAAFDKEWVFQGARRSTGKVRQQMHYCLRPRKPATLSRRESA